MGQGMNPQSMSLVSHHTRACTWPSSHRDALDRKKSNKPAKLKGRAELNSAIRMLFPGSTPGEMKFEAHV